MQRDVFHTQTALAKALQALLQALEAQLELTQPLHVYLAGGMAMHLYTAVRVTTDVDADFAKRVRLPPDLSVELTLEDGRPRTLYLDSKYNSTLGLMHEDYQDDAIPLDLQTQRLVMHVLSPVDLAVSKISRFADNDRADIAALVRLGLTSAQAIEERATQALGGFVGGLAMLQFNIRDAAALARQVETESLGDPDLPPIG